MRIARFMATRLKTPMGMTVMHVGAHRAQEARSYEAWGVSRVIWIEANPRMIPAIEQALEDARAMPQPRVAKMLGLPRTEHILINALVGDEDGEEVLFYLYDNDGASNSIYQKTEDARAAIPEVGETGEALMLPMRRIDSLLTERSIDPDSVGFVTLDVQGAELKCLKGAPKLLARLRFLETEISKDAFYEGGVLLPELDKFLMDLGFRQKRWLRRSHMNAIYMR